MKTSRETAVHYGWGEGCNDFEEPVEFLVISHPATRGDRVLVEGSEGE